MKSLSDLNYTGKSLIREGVLTILVGLLLFFYGSTAPRVAIELFTFWMFITALWSLLTRWFRKKGGHENIAGVIIKMIVSFIIGNSLFVENTLIYVVVFFVSIYQLFEATINFVTYMLYRKNDIKPRWKYLFDSMWLSCFGIFGLIPTETRGEFQLGILGIYLMMLGMTYLRDGIWFNSEVGKNKLKRRVRVSMPLFIAALIPANTLDRVNTYLQNSKDEIAEDDLTIVKENKDAELEVFIHTSQTNVFGAIGHVDICYNNQVISYGSYDPTSERLFGTVGDGVLFIADREKYITFCQQESHKTLFGYGIDLTVEQQKDVEKQIEELKSLTIPWEPQKTPIPNKNSGKEEPMYAYKLMQEADAQLFKFTSSKFKTYFVLSTNCVLLADSIIGKAGTDVLSVKGFISPGTYQEYLNKEFARPNSIVVSKSVYLDLDNLSVEQ
ncbi:MULTISPECIES: DUF308 domain-containing protein [unclassified Granulicatella]|uniref:DUF308 domain-containing protein n=1 Tax=unclassified Granulicatella TaxID=2630493 RepID=UPI00107449C8|nr:MULTISPECIES: DUF308 domain-containing protein [unclassified Granulicatella]MBF0779999.1 DUF308 domain-containing protein [Granulicatella sp. 19428wC4_WM01]TFU95926.1 DUF308 domain-containing protein [Granulicatella sp. WM01]